MLYATSPLHDIGKVAIPDAILNKQATLNEMEFDEIKKHTRYGTEVIQRTEDILGSSSFLQYARELTEYHHERWDGSGYPRGLKGTDIPLSGRIVAVADVFDALSSKRVYKPAFPIDKCFAILEEESGTHFDPTKVAALKQLGFSDDDIMNLQSHAEATEKAAAMFTKEQLAESETKASNAEQKAELISGKYRSLHAKVSRAMDNNPAPFGFASDPLGEPAKPGDAAAPVVAVDAPIENILTNVLALDADSGIVAFSVGEANGIKAKDIFDVKIAGKKVGKVQISTVKGVLSFGQLQPDKELDIRAISKAGSVSLAPSTKLAAN